MAPGFCSKSPLPSSLLPSLADNLSQAAPEPRLPFHSCLSCFHFLGTGICKPNHFVKILLGSLLPDDYRADSLDT